jgi:hypothetical protein
MEKVIYTCNLNNYDSLKEPTIITPGWRYVYYTNDMNDMNLRSTVWEPLYINVAGSKEARRVKILNPHREADISIWIDASMTINCDLDKFVQQNCKSDFNLLSHPDRRCIYEEAEVCIKRKKDDPNIITNQINSYRQQNYPRNNGMVATGVIVRRKNELVNQFCEKWWGEVSKGSRRDQLSFNYVNWKNPINYNLIPFDILKSDFILNKHI